MAEEGSSKEEELKRRKGELAKSLFARRIQLSSTQGRDEGGAISSFGITGDENEEEDIEAAFDIRDLELPDLEGLEDVEKTLEILSTATAFKPDQTASSKVEEASDRETVLHQIRMDLIRDYSRSGGPGDKFRGLQGDEYRREIGRYFSEECEKHLQRRRVRLISKEKGEFVESVVSEVAGFGPLDRLLKDPSISEIMVNGPRRIFIEKGGDLDLTDVRFFDEEHLFLLAQRIAAQIGRQLDLAHPYVDARLPDGSRVHVIIPPLARDGTTITIRKFKEQTLQMEDMIAFGALTPDMAYFLGACVKARLNILVAGGTGTGKTTMLNVISTLVQSGQRIVVIEDSSELKVHEAHPHVVRLETREASGAGGGRGGVSIRDLVKCSLRMRPDRVVVGECRGGEAIDMLQAMNTGHDGSMTTAHANSAREMLQRLETMCLMSGVELPADAIRRQISTALDLIVHLRRYPDGSRKVSEISEILEYRGGEILLRKLFYFDAKTRDKSGRVIGEFKVSNELPSFIYKFEAEGLRFPYEIFGAPIAKREDGGGGNDSAPIETEREFFPADVSSIDPAAAWVASRLASIGMDEKRVSEAELAFVEAFGNVVRHAYPEGTEGQVTVEISSHPGSAGLSVVDSGEPFDPVSTSPRERVGDEEHGMGLMLMKEYTDDLFYEYKDGMNTLTMRFNLA